MASPTYHKIGDHTETVQLDYDPNLISYDELLDIFWNSHDPTRSSRPGQYMKAVFYHNEQQRLQAMASAGTSAEQYGQTITPSSLSRRAVCGVSTLAHRSKGLESYALELTTVRLPIQEDLLPETANPTEPIVWPAVLGGGCAPAVPLSDGAARHSSWELRIHRALHAVYGEIPDQHPCPTDARRLPHHWAEPTPQLCRCTVATPR